MTFHETAFIIGMGIIGLLLVGVIVALFTTGATLRMRIAVVGPNGIESEWAHKRNLRVRNGHPWYAFQGMLYDWTGPWYPIRYRMVRSFGIRKYTGAQRLYIEGNPTPYRFNEDERMAALHGTAKHLHDEADSDIPNRLLRPRRVDVLLLVLVGILSLFAGIAVGGRI